MRLTNPFQVIDYLANGRFLLDSTTLPSGRLRRSAVWAQALLCTESVYCCYCCTTLRLHEINCPRLFVHTATQYCGQILGFGCNRHEQKALLLREGGWRTLPHARVIVGAVRV